MRRNEIDQYYLTEHNHAEVTERMKREQKILQPYFDIFKGLEVPRSTLPDVVTEAVTVLFEQGKLDQRINEQGEIVVLLRPEKP